jgi:hypothetical protein
MIHGIDQRFPLADASVEPLFLRALAERYRLQPLPASFRVIVAPLTSWVWAGGLIALLGGAVALWPGGALAAVALRRRRSRARRVPVPVTEGA